MMEVGGGGKRRREGVIGSFGWGLIGSRGLRLGVGEVTMVGTSEAEAVVGTVA